MHDDRCDRPAGARGQKRQADQGAQVGASWRDRALNAEGELKRTHAEIASQRGRIGELLGRIRDLENDLPEDGTARTISENHALQAQVRQLTQDNREGLEERLAGARDNNRFLDKRIAELEAQLTVIPGRQETP